MKNCKKWDLCDEIEQRHKPEIHVQLLVAMEKSQARVIGNEIYFSLLIPSQHKHIFEDARRLFPCNLGEFKAVPVKMDGMDIVTRIPHANAVTLARF